MPFLQFLELTPGEDRDCKILKNSSWRPVAVPPVSFIELWSTVVQVAVNLLRKDANLRSTLDCMMSQPTLWSVIMGNWVGKPEWMICSVKLAFTAKEYMSYWWISNVVFLKPLFEKSDREKGAREVWGINEECPKCHFEHLICRKPLYWDDNIFLVHRTSFGPGTWAGSGSGSSPVCLALCRTG